MNVVAFILLISGFFVCTFIPVHTLVYHFMVRLWFVHWLSICVAACNKLYAPHVWPVWWCSAAESPLKAVEDEDSLNPKAAVRLCTVALWGVLLNLIHTSHIPSESFSICAPLLRGSSHLLAQTQPGLLNWKLKAMSIPGTFVLTESAVESREEHLIYSSLAQGHLSPHFVASATNTNYTQPLLHWLGSNFSNCCHCAYRQL